MKFSILASSYDCMIYSLHVSTMVIDFKDNIPSKWCSAHQFILNVYP